MAFDYLGSYRRGQLNSLGAFATRETANARGRVDALRAEQAAIGVVSILRDTNDIRHGFTVTPA